MAILQIQDAIEKARQNPNSDFAKLIRSEIESGRMDAPAAKQGVDLSPFGRSNLSFAEDAKRDIQGIGTGIKEATEERMDKFQDIKEAKASGEQGAFRSFMQAFGQGTGLAGDVLGQTVLGVGKAVLPDVAERKVGEIAQEGFEKIANIDMVQQAIKDFQTLEEVDPARARDVEGILNTLLLGLDIGTAGVAGKGTKLASTGIAKSARGGVSTIKKGTKRATDVIEDVVPTPERLVEFQVTRALDLTQGDVKNIARSTGNEVGEFLADTNLIRGTKAETLDAVNNFFETNFNQVRDEIGKVGNTYNLSEIPRATDALTALKSQVKDVPGLEDINRQVDTLLKKKDLSLNDVQNIKELLDDQFDLFKVTGDVKEGTAKKGLAVVRDDIKEFIEKEVKDSTGADIKTLNNNVATSKSISNAITDRSTRGLTRSTLKLGDLGVFGLGASLGGGPLTGVALVVGKKIAESAPIRLRVAKWLDGLNDAKKAKVIKELQEGKAPKELRRIVDLEDIKVPVVSATKEGSED